MKTGSYKFPEWLSDGSKELISQLLQIDPKKRIPIAELLKHPWLTKNVNVPIEWKSKYKVFELFSLKQLLNQVFDLCKKKKCVIIFSVLRKA